jgi:hypothetical protein
MPGAFQSVRSWGLQPSRAGGATARDCSGGVDRDEDGLNALASWRAREVGLKLFEGHFLP